ncbi:MAG TPA: hypothetical protein VIE90_03650 [Candidatus Binatia bacterium]|jgi:hypothetical protein
MNRMNPPIAQRMGGEGSRNRRLGIGLAVLIASYVIAIVWFIVLY